MAKKLQEIFDAKVRQIAQSVAELPPVVANEWENFTKENFEQEGWQGDSFEAWPRRKNPTAWGKKDDTTRKLLIQRRKLLGSIRSVTGEDKVTLIAGGADVPYAKTHNEGFEGTVTQEVGEHARKGKKGQEFKVKAFTRTIQQQIPKRQFAGLNSSQLRHRLREAAKDHLKTRLGL